MSNRQSKNNYEEARKTYYSRVSERTRSKSEAYLSVETSGIPSSSDDRIRERKRKRQMKPALSIGGQRKKSGNNRVGMDKNVHEIERVDFESLVNKEVCSASKRRRGSTYADMSWKNDGAPSKKPSATVEISDASKRSFHVQEGNGNEDSDSGGCGFEMIDKAEFILLKSLAMSNRGYSSKGKMNGSSSSATFKKDASNVSKRASSDDYCESFSLRDVARGSEHVQPSASISFIQIDSDNDEMIPEDIEIQRVDEAEIRNQETYSKSRSSAQKVNRDEDRNHETGFEMIDESEFRNCLRGYVSKIRSSTSQEQVEEHIAGTSAKNVRRVRGKISSSGENNRNRKKRLASGSSLKKNGGAWKKNVVDDDVGSSLSDSSSRTESDNVDVNTSLQDSEVSLYGAEQDIAAGIANRTRTKMGTIKKASQVGQVSLGSSVDSDSSADGGFDSLDADFEVEIWDHDIELDRAFHYDADAEEKLKETEPNGSDLLCHTKAKTTDMADEMKVPAGTEEAAPPSQSKNGYDHSGDAAKESVTSSGSHVRAKNKTRNMAKEKKVPAGSKEAAPPSDSNDGHDHSDAGTKGITEAATTSCSHQRAKNKHAGMVNLKEVPSGGKKAAPPSHSNNGCVHSDVGTMKGTEAAMPTDSHLCAKNKGAGMVNVEKVPTGGNEAAPPSHSKYDERAEAAMTSDSHLRAKSKTSGMVNVEKVLTRQKEAAAPSHSKYVYDQMDEGAKERTEAAISGSHDHAETEAADMDNETEVSMRRKQVHPKQIKDFCSMLADAVLGNGEIPITKEIYEEVEQAPASPAQSTLPLKFRFEDEVPEQVEKTEYEKEIDDLFGELDCNWALKELQTFDYPEDKVENENSPPGETQHARCCRGKHDLILEDDEGLICRFCRHVELGPKDVMPEWVERIYRESERKRCPETDIFVEFDELHMHTSTSDDVDADAGSSSHATGTVWSIKPGVRESMYEHQREGFEFLWRNLAGSIDLDELNSTDKVEVGGCIISHAPGTGKTRLTMVFIETYLKKFPNCRPVIISPASTLLTWEEEFKKWNVEFPFHNLSNLELSSKENKTALGLLCRTNRRDQEAIRMIKICSWSMGRSILGISYSLFQQLTREEEEEKKKKKKKKKKKREALATGDGKMRKILLEKPGLVVLDEGHTPRNSRSNIWNVILKLQTEKRIILSGTPFQNNFSELFNTLRIVRPAVADNLAQERMFAEAIAPRRNSSSIKHRVATEHSISKESLEHLKSCMSPFVHLHRGTILKQSLPGLRDCVIILKPPMLQKRVIDTLEGSSNFQFDHEVAMISVHPYLLCECKTTESRKIRVDMAALEASKLSPQEGAKTRFLLELLHLSMAVKEKVLVFSQYIQPLELIKEQLQEILKWTEGNQILHMKGVLPQKQRQILLNLFNDPQSESKIMLASTKCCAEGISLIGASRVVLLDVMWNPSVERQAICRAYRIGQKKFVHTYHLMTDGTPEDDKYCRQALKDRLSELVFSTSDESNQQKHTSLGIEDRILELMVASDGTKGMFEKIINQPKETDLIHTFGLTS